MGFFYDQIFASNPLHHLNRKCLKENELNPPYLIAITLISTLTFNGSLDT